MVFSAMDSLVVLQGAEKFHPPKMQVNENQQIQKLLEKGDLFSMPLPFRTMACSKEEVESKMHPGLWVLSWDCGALELCLGSSL